MNLPKHIEKAIVKCATHNAIAVNAQREIESWLEKQGVDTENDTLRDQLIDCVEISNNPRVFIEFLKEYECL